MHVVVVGGGVGGLGVALALARTEHQVTLLERDATSMPLSPAGAFEWERRGAPQVRHSHAFLARLRNLLASRAPDVLEALIEAGATELRFCDNLPDTLVDFEPLSGDDELVALACRRTTFEWVLRRVVLSIEGVTIRDGVAVHGLLHGEEPCGVPRVIGVQSDHGDIAADLVVDASGPRSASQAWLQAIGVSEPAPDVFESEIVYLSRFYELIDGAEVPDARGPIGGDLGYLKYAVFIGDNRTFSVTLAVDVRDRELRAPLATVAGFEAAASQLVAAQPWLDGRSTPLTGVHVMAGLRNRKRCFVVDDEPIVTGFVAVGDAALCTNPLYGRGCSLALVHAFALADALQQHLGDPVALAVSFHDATERELDPWFRAAVQQDREAIEVARAAREPSRGARAPASGGGVEPLGARAPASGGEVDPRAWAREVFRDGLLPAVRTSPAVFRAFLRWFNLLATPDALITDTEVISAALQSYARRDERPPEPALGPESREEFVAALGQ